MNSLDDRRHRRECRVSIRRHGTSALREDGVDRGAQLRDVHRLHRVPRNECWIGERERAESVVRAERATAPQPLLLEKPGEENPRRRQAHFAELDVHN